MKKKTQDMKTHKASKIKRHQPGKGNKWGQATGGWSPYGPPTGQKDICPTCGGARSYEAFDRATGQWFTYNCTRC